MIRIYKCPSCGTEMKIYWDENVDAEPMMCPFCGHEFDDEENDYEDARDTEGNEDYDTFPVVTITTTPTIPTTSTTTTADSENSNLFERNPRDFPLFRNILRRNQSGSYFGQISQ